LWQRMEGEWPREGVPRPKAGCRATSNKNSFPPFFQPADRSRPSTALRGRQFHSDLPPIIFLQCYLFATFMSLKTTSFRFLLLFVWAEDGKRVSLQHSQLPSSLAPERRPRPQPIPPNSIPSPSGVRSPHSFVNASSSLLVSFFSFHFSSFCRP
jgi:hypothetical protein